MNQTNSGRFGVAAEAVADQGDAVELSAFIRNRYDIECHDADGNLKWIDHVDNIFVNAGLNDLLNKYLKGSSYTAAFYVGLLSSTPTVAAADTMLSHGGWTEVTDYLNSPDRRPTLTLGTVASQSVNNSASKAVFAITGTVTVGGIFITTSNTRINGSPIAGTLIAAGAFTGGNRSLINGDTLSVTITITASSS